LWGHVEEILLLNTFFPLSIRALVAKLIICCGLRFRKSPVT